MEASKHLSKATRLENTMRKLELGDDCETIIENCMLAGTHLVNAALHKAKLSEADIIHSHLMAVDRVKGLIIAPSFAVTQGDLKTAFGALQKIEFVRPEFVRGDGQCDSALASDILRQYDLLKRSCYAVLGLESAR